MSAPRLDRSNIVICVWEHGRISYHGSWSELADAAQWAENHLDHLGGVVTWRARTINVGWSDGVDGMARLLSYQSAVNVDLAPFGLPDD